MSQINLQHGTTTGEQEDYKVKNGYACKQSGESVESVQKKKR